MVRYPCSLACGASVFLRLLPDAGIRLLDHLLAKIHADQVVLKNVVVEHVFGRLTQIDDPFGHRRRPDAERHILRIRGAGSVIVAADAADAAGDEMGVARIFSFHEDAVAAKDRGGAVALGDSALPEVDLRKDSKTAHDPGNRIPVHFH